MGTRSPWCRAPRRPSRRWWYRGSARILFISGVFCRAGPESGGRCSGNWPRREVRESSTRRPTGCARRFRISWRSGRAGRRVAVARELTKQFEEVVRGTFAEVAAHFATAPPLGELTIVAAGLEERTGGSGAAGRTAPSHAASAFLAEQEAAHAAEEGRAFEQDVKQAGGAAPHVPAGHAPGEHRGTTAGDGGFLADCGGCQASPDHIREAVAALIKAGADTSSACKAVAKALGLSKSQVYRLYHKE